CDRRHQAGLADLHAPRVIPLRDRGPLVVVCSRRVRDGISDTCRRHDRPLPDERPFPTGELHRVPVRRSDDRSRMAVRTSSHVGPGSRLRCPRHVDAV
ncbi:uncharacterized protein METZ01_LOCUS377704, partial [marine metagenome]